MRVPLAGVRRPRGGADHAGAERAVGDAGDAEVAIKELRRGTRLESVIAQMVDEGACHGSISSSPAVTLACPSGQVQDARGPARLCAIVGKPYTAPRLPASCGG